MTSIILVGIGVVVLIAGLSIGKYVQKKKADDVKSGRFAKREAARQAEGARQDEQQRIADEQSEKQRAHSVKRPIGAWRVISALLFIVSLGLIGASIYLFSVGTPTANQPSAPITVSARQLVTDYASNAVAADQKYKNHYLEISGIVKSIGRDFLGNPYVVIAALPQEATNGVQCQFDASHDNELAALLPGQQILVEGIGDGYVITTAMVKDCTIVQAFPPTSP